jgi:hypothetical protein
VYDPHKDVDLVGESEVMSKGRLVKVRFLDQAPPNVDWFWLPIGNCHACTFYQRADVGIEPKCLSPKISTEDFFDKYMVTNTCPEFSAGIAPQKMASRVDLLDVMKAIGVASGAPSQQVAVIHNLPWTMYLADRAHREASVFLDMAHLASRIADGTTENNPAWEQYVDLADDLERPTPGGGAKP